MKRGRWTENARYRYRERRGEKERDGRETGRRKRYTEEEC